MIEEAIRRWIRVVELRGSRLDEGGSRRTRRDWEVGSDDGSRLRLRIEARGREVDIWMGGGGRDDHSRGRWRLDG